MRAGSTFFKTWYLPLCICVLLLANQMLYGQMRDTDGQNYYSEILDDSEWITANLNVSKFTNGDPIFYAQNEQQWLQAIQSKRPAYCYYNFDPKNEGEYGKLYNSYVILDERNIAPGGWHLPSIEEAGILANFLLNAKPTYLEVNKIPYYPEDGRLALFGYSTPPLKIKMTGLSRKNGGSLFLFRKENGFKGKDKSGTWWTSTSKYDIIDKEWRPGAFTYHSETHSMTISHETKNLSGFAIRLVKDDSKYRRQEAAVKNFFEYYQALLDNQMQVAAKFLPSGNSDKRLKMMNAVVATKSQKYHLTTRKPELINMVGDKYFKNQSVIIFQAREFLKFQQLNRIQNPRTDQEKTALSLQNLDMSGLKLSLGNQYRSHGRVSSDSDKGSIDVWVESFVWSVYNSETGDYIFRWENELSKEEKADILKYFKLEID